MPTLIFWFIFLCGGAPTLSFLPIGCALLDCFFVTVTGRTRRETCGYICKALFQNMVKYRQGQTSVDRYVKGKTQEYSRSKRGSTIGEQYPTGQGREIIQVY